MPVRTGKSKEGSGELLGEIIKGAAVIVGGAAYLTGKAGVKAVEVVGDAIDTTRKDFQLKEDVEKQIQFNQQRMAESIEAYSKTEWVLREEARQLDKIADKIISDFKKIDETILNNTTSTKITEKDLNNFTALNFSGAMFGAVAGGAAAAGGAVALVTAFCTAGTGAAISSLSGIFAVKATLATLGFGTLASGGLGMAGGVAVLGGLFAVPALAVGGFLAHNKIRESVKQVNEETKAITKAIEENGKLAERNKLASDNFRQIYDLGVAIDFFLKNLQYRVEVAPEKIKADMQKISKVARDKLIKKFVEIKPVTDDEMNISDTLEETLQKIENECRTLQNLLNSRGKIYTSLDINPVFQQIYSDAEKHIYMSYPWFDTDYVNEDLNLMNGALLRGVKIYIYYGIGDRQIAPKTANAINLLKRQLVSPNLVKFVRVNSHRKIILCERYVLQGSQNMMSYRYSEGDHDQREEVTVKIEDIEFVNECKNLILNQKEI